MKNEQTHESFDASSTEASAMAPPSPTENLLLKISRIILSILFSILFFLLTLSTVFLGFAHHVLSPNGIENLLSRIDLAEVVLPAMEEKLSDALLDEPKTQEILEKYGVNTEEIQPILDEIEPIIKKIEWKETASVILSSYIDSVLKAKRFELNASDLTDLIDQNQGIITEVVGEEKIDFDQVKEQIRSEIVPKINENIPQIKVSDVQQTLGISPEIAIHTGQTASLSTILIVAAIALFAAFLILVFNRFHIRPWLSYVGVSTIALGGLLLLSSALLYTAFGSLISFGNEIVNGIVNALMIPNLLIVIIIGGIFLFFGLLAVILPRIIEGRKGAVKNEYT